MDEEWRSHLEHTSYEISSLGRVKRNNKVLSQSEHVGYMSVHIYKNCKQETKYAHRLVAETFLPNEHSLLFVNHKDGNRSNNCVENLEWVTRSQNAQHARSSGLIKTKKRKIQSINPDTGEILCTFDDIKKAAEETNVSKTQIARSLDDGKIVNGGFRFKLESDYVKIRIPEPEGSQSINGYPKYLITDCGLIYSQKLKNYLKPNTCTEYATISLYQNKQPKSLRIHRLVAQCFLLNPHDYPVVNHKDGNKFNNCVSNLEWVSHSQNTKHAIEIGTLPGKRKVRQIHEITGSVIAEYDSIKEASSATDIISTSIVKAAKGHRITAGGYKWDYYEI